MSQHSVAVANEAAKNPELLGSTNQDTASEQVKVLKEQEKARKADAKFSAQNRNSFADLLDGSENGVAAQSGQDATQNALDEAGSKNTTQAPSVTADQPEGQLTQEQRDSSTTSSDKTDASSDSSSTSTNDNAGSNPGTSSTTVGTEGK